MSRLESGELSREVPAAIPTWRLQQLPRTSVWGALWGSGRPGGRGPTDRLACVAGGRVQERKGEATDPHLGGPHKTPTEPAAGGGGPGRTCCVGLLNDTL